MKILLLIGSLLYLTTLFGQSTELKRSQQPLDFKLYPVPSHGTINVSLNMGIEGGSLRIIDMLGKEHIHINLNASQLNYHFNDLKRGVYFIEIELSNDTKQARRFVVE